MSGHDIIVLAAMILYFIVVLSVGFYYAKRASQSSKDYFLGGRKVNPIFTAMSAEASDMSGYLLMGIPGLAYFTGLADAMWTSIGLCLGTYLNWKLVAHRLRRYSVVANDSITIPGFFSKRFHDDKNILSTISALIILLFFCIYTASCFVSCGRLFSTLFGFSYVTMMVLAALVVFIYTMVGGYLSVVATDTIQACLMFVALVVIVVGSVVMANGVGETAAVLQSFPGFLAGNQISNPTLDPSTEAQLISGGAPVFGAAKAYGPLTVISTMAWGLGYFGMPHILVRFMGIRTVEEVKISRRIAVTWVVISMAAAVCIGLLGRAIYPTMFTTESAAESIFIVLSQSMLPAFFCGIVVSGIFAASMSSSSSYLLVAGSSIAENIYRGIFKKDASDKQVMFVARIALFVVFLVGIFIARDESSSIFGVVSYAWAGLGASFGPLVILSLYWRRTNIPGALAGMFGGAATVLIWHNLIKPLGGVWGIYELLPAFIISAACIVVVSLMTKPPADEVLYEFDHYMDDEYFKKVEAERMAALHG